MKYLFSVFCHFVSGTVDMGVSPNRIGLASKANSAHTSIVQRGIGLEYPESRAWDPLTWKQ